ncbi:hypothetical protein Klosneuvirus_4_32 [Klosneuvirus KNV1]|uniref:Uncharacterized protein n=1 Tax=Klosneuvirus KNV1 TaxID=1977640 RepID=A0A1V0SKG6_9VIRU|nr:hypothetical protein Klosneuvirus_4_32 [Klosneuvirus KNV1]
MVKYLFVYGILVDTLNNFACKINPAIAYGMKLTIHKTDNTPAIIPTYDLCDYVNGQVIKVCNPNKMTELFNICDQVAFGFNKKILQIMIGNKKVDAFAYFPNEMSMYDEIDQHSYSEYKASNS